MIEVIEILKQVFVSPEAPIGLITLGIRPGKKIKEEPEKMLDNLFSSSGNSRKNFAYANYQRANRAY